MGELRDKIRDLFDRADTQRVCNINAFVDDVLDAVIEALPKTREPRLDEYDSFGDYSHVLRMRNSTIDEIKAILEAAKEGK